MKMLQLAGQRFGRLRVIERDPNGAKRVMWRCVCDCGREATVRSQHLSSGATQSCGCLTVERNRDRATHGMSRTTTHVIWKTMRARCQNPTASGYADYGSRGITVCEAWDSFEVFLADMGERPPGMSIERIDNSKGYAPENCRWASNSEQCRNRRSTHLIEYRGKTQCRKDWAIELGVTAQRLNRQIEKLGIENAFELLRK
ncbi:hypothetical protein JAB9_47130 [Janthinobacterium sp. HH107]|nr:hypothetical protein JAB9_47130 [Janthinobacterium sp. HH107]